MPQRQLDVAVRSLSEDRPAALDRLQQLLRIPSVSADPARKPAIRQAAQWLVAQLGEIGLDARVLETTGNPLAFATTPAGRAARPGPRVLFYGHYDVQPPDPLELWQTPPFEPTIRDGAVYARGASDDKGQVCCFLEALRAWTKSHDQLPLPVTVMIEGEEEGGGEAALSQFIADHRDLLAADVALVCDSGMWDGPKGPIPAITYGLRGIVYFDVRLFGPSRDLHSGAFGGAVPNPATLLARVLGRLLDQDNRVTIPGFYDDVVPASEDDRRRWQSLPFDEQQALRDVGLTQAFGERGHSTLERLWSRPSCDVNGLFGGYSGVGAKTIIPSFAGAKLSFRLVPNQDPIKIGQLVRHWLLAQDVAGCRWAIEQVGEAWPVLVSTKSPFVSAATGALRAAAGQDPVLIRDGATIPVVATFKRLLGLDTLLIGFGRENDCIHSPNEKFDLAQFDLGCRALTVLLAELAS